MNKIIDALKLAEEALVYHTQQTRPIQKTDEALAAIREALAEQDKQEPVAIVDEIGKRLDGTYIFNAVGKVDVGQPLYAAPVSAKREWVELTDDEIGAVMDFGYATDSELENAHAVIAAFKEKNKSNTQLKQSREEEGYVPLSNDAKFIFIDGFGEVPIDWDKYHGMAAPAQPVKQEPVAHYKDAPHTIYLQTGCDDPEDCECSFNEWGDTTWCTDQIHDTDIPYIRADYAAPVSAKREWVDLTCQEVTALIMEGAAGGGWQGFAERVQAAYKEKNNG